jgi:hypothetical protein
MRPQVAHCHFWSRQTAYRRAAIVSRPRSTSPPRWRCTAKMGMTYWLEQAEAELRRVRHCTTLCTTDIRFRSSKNGAGELPYHWHEAEIAYRTRCPIPHQGIPRWVTCIGRGNAFDQG